jgi:hypothetical protein
VADLARDGSPMKDSDITMIEQALSISLPESYKRAVVPFRIPYLAGNTDYQLWDDAKGLVDLNKKLRAGSRMCPAWPPHFFAVGDPHGDEKIALDTRSPDGPVWWLDHGIVDSKASYQSHSKFEDWADGFYRDIRSDLEGDGKDPDGKPNVEKPIIGWEVLCELLSLVGVAVLVLFILHAIRLWMKKH